jgi:hypothetical protein
VCCERAASQVEAAPAGATASAARGRAAAAERRAGSMAQTGRRRRSTSDRWTGSGRGGVRVGKRRRCTPVFLRMSAREGPGRRPAKSALIAVLPRARSHAPKPVQHRARSCADCDKTRVHTALLLTTIPQAHSRPSQLASPSLSHAPRLISVVSGTRHLSCERDARRHDRRGG